MLLDIERDRDLLTRLYSEYSSRQGKFIDIENYYRGNTGAKRKYEITDRSNRKCSVGYMKKFTEEETAFAVGNDTTYISRSNDADVIKYIEYVFYNQNSNIDVNLCFDLLMFGIGYEMYYVSDGEFKIKDVSPRNAIVYENEEGKAELMLYFYQKMLDDTIYVDVIDDRYIYKFDNKFGQPTEVIEHYFNRCPVGVAKLVHGIYDTIYSDIHELQDCFEMSLWDNCNNVADLRASYLAFYGAELAEETTKNMKKMGILQFKNSDSKAEWLTKNLDAEYSKNLTDKLEDLIYQISQHINHNVVLSSNTSGIALSSRLISMRNKVTIIQKCLQSCIKTRLQCLFRYAEVYENKKIDYKDIIVKFTMNLPADNVSMAQISSQLSDKLSIRTGLSQLSFVTDADKEFEKMLEEQRMIAENSMSSLDDINTTNDVNTDGDMDE